MEDATITMAETLFGCFFDVFQLLEDVNQFFGFATDLIDELMSEANASQDSELATTLCGVVGVVTDCGGLLPGYYNECKAIM